MSAQLQDRLRIDIPLLPQANAGSALQFVDLLRSANLVARLRHGSRARAIAWRLLDGEGRALQREGVPDWIAPYLASADADAVDGLAAFVPPLLVPDVPTLQRTVARSRTLVQALGRVADAGGTVMTLGNAAWLPAASGRYDGCRAALPWFFAAGFSRQFPGVPVAGDLVVEDARWSSAATLHGLTRLATQVVRQALGDAMARVAQRAFEPDLERTRAAAAATTSIPVTRAGAAARAMRWLQDHVAEPYDLARVADAAAVSQRTLLRHFQREFGRSPLDCLHQLRCERAQVMLEITLESVPSIAVACGYADPTAFRRIFLRYQGTTPQRYRQEHALRAPRSRWQVDVARL